MIELQPNDFRYTLTIDEKDYVLINAPEGWEETFLNFKRSGNYYGLVRSFTVPLKFVLDGAYLLRKAFYTEGMGSSVILRIEELNRANWLYRNLYHGEIDLVDFDDSGNLEGNSVTVSCTDIGIAEMIATYDRTEYEILLTSQNSFLVQLPSVSIIDVAQDLVLPQDYSYLPNGARQILPNEVDENDLINGHVETQIVDPENDPDFSTSENWIVRATQDTEIVVSGTFEGILAVFGVSERIFVELINQDGQVKATFISYVRGGAGYIEGSEGTRGEVGERETDFTHKIDFSETISMTSGEKLFLTMRKQGGERGVFRVSYMPVKITNEIQTEPSECRAIKANDLFVELISKMNNGDAQGAKSDLLESSNIFVTCGDAIREFENPVLKTSFQDFYRSFDAVLNVGFGIDVVPRLEKKEFFYRNVPCIDLGEIKSFGLTVDEDFIFNSMKTGYRSQKYEQDQGREEFNQGQFWSSPNRKTDKVLEIISEYRADQYGIAVLRRLTISDNIKGVDSESDNDIWMLQGLGVEEEGLQLLEKGSDLDYVTGIPNPENAINVRLSPHRNMQRNGSLIRVGLVGFESGVLQFTSSDKNARLSSQIDGKIVKENQNQSIASLSNPLFLPHKVKLKTALPLNSWVIITSNMYGYFTFKYNSFDFKAFIKEATSDVAKDTEQELILNLHPDTDLTKLIL